MNDTNAATDKNAIAAWYKSQLDTVVKEMLRLGAVTGIAIEASPAWMSPHKILIAKVWDASL
jgi:hypothetical protein